MKGVDPSPIRGQQAPTISVGADQAGQVQAEELKQLGGLKASDIDAFAGALQKLSEPSTGGAPKFFERILAPLKPRDPKAQQAISQRSADIQQKVAGAAEELTQIYADGLVTEQELTALGRATAGMQNILAMNDERALQMLPRDVRKRLEQHLFGKLTTLVRTAQIERYELINRLKNRDEEALREKLNAPVEYRTLPESQSPGSMERYQAGDLIAVNRYNKKPSLGVVVENEGNKLRVAVWTDTGLGIRDMSPEDVQQHNPLKIGDYVENHEGHQIWVSGMNANGELVGVGRGPDGERLEISAPELRGIATALEKKAALMPVEDVGERVPIDGVAVVAGGAQTRDQIMALTADTVSGGLYTSRGPTIEEHGLEYKAYNEDAGVLGVHGKGDSETVVVGALDQAGGMDVIPGMGDGATSKIAAEALAAAGEKIAAGADPKEALIQGALDANRTILELNQAHGTKSLTTITGGVIKDGVAHVVSCGDSKVWHFSKDGRLKNESETHNYHDKISRETGDPNAMLHMAAAIYEALGSKEDPDIKYAAWDLEPGDYLVYGSDGICDANLEAQRTAKEEGHPWDRSNSEVTSEALSGLIAQSEGPMDATEAIRDYALQGMADGRGKPDNTTVTVVQVR